MDYNRIYHNLVTTRQNLKRFKSKETFYESHHILPKCLRGSDDITNLVLLTPKEHYIAHLLLTKMYVGKEKFKMYFAFWRMSSRLKILNANQYQYAKELLITAAKNKVISPEQKEKLSKAHLGKTLSPEHREKNIKNLEQYRNTEKRLANLKEALKKNIGKKLSKEAIEKRTASRQKNGVNVWNKGQVGITKMSDETIKQRTKTRKENGWYPNGKASHSEETKEKIKNAMKGKTPSKATLDKAGKYQQRPVLQFSLDNIFIKEWNSIKEAKEGTNAKQVSDCCHNRQKTSGGFIFQFK